VHTTGINSLYKAAEAKERLGRSLTHSPLSLSMVFQVITGAATALAFHLYPSYATFKVLARREGTDSQDVEKWLTYWCVVGAFVALETGFGWIVDWLPFYSELKILFLFFLTRGGAGVIYKGFLEPKYAIYEPQIDAHLAQLRTRTAAYVQEQLQRVYRLVLGAAAAAQNEPQPPPTPQGVAAGATDIATNLWGTYGQGALAAGARYLQSGGAQSQDPHSHTSSSPNAYSTGVNSNGVHFPMPYRSSRVPSSSSAEYGYSIPIIPSDVNLPRRTPSPH